MYWRLLSTDPEAAKDVVLAEKPVIADNSAALEPSLLQQLLADLSTLASVRGQMHFIGHAAMQTRLWNTCMPSS